MICSTDQSNGNNNPLAPPNWLCWSTAANNLSWWTSFPKIIRKVNYHYINPQPPSYCRTGWTLTGWLCFQDEELNHPTVSLCNYNSNESYSLPSSFKSRPRISLTNLISKQPCQTLWEVIFFNQAINQVFASSTTQKLDTPKCGWRLSAQHCWPWSTGPRQKGCL